MQKSNITVTFKETYLPYPVTRTCYNMTEEQIIEYYGLNQSDIEWYKFENTQPIEVVDTIYINQVDSNLMFYIPYGNELL